MAAKSEKKTKQYVYLFKEAHGLGKELLGGKGSGLAEMHSIGINIPEGFTITTEACTLYYNSHEKIPAFLEKEILTKLHELEKLTGKKFGGKENPLLLSVRSGARVSMPGMMDTILNLGLNDETVEALKRKTNNGRFAYDCYRRFMLMFTNIAMGLSRDEMDAMLDELKKAKGYKNDYEVTEDELKELIKKYKAYYKSKFKTDFPSDPIAQLMTAIRAIFRSWNNPRAILFRRLNNIPGDWGTAVTVMQMAYGNMGEKSGTGVGFTRSASTGENKISAEFLQNAQGEDVVAGIRTPDDISKLHKLMPKVYDELVKDAKKLERHYHDMQDFEFTVEEGKLFMLQTRSAKRTAKAALKIAIDLAKEGICTQEEALTKIDAHSLDQLLHPTFVEADLKKAIAIAQGNPASPGSAVGHLSFDAADAKARHDAGEKVILVRAETAPEDLEGMVSSEGVLTMRGGMTSHAAVVARGMGICAVTGCGAAIVDEKNRKVTINGKTYGEKDTLSLNGSTGMIYEGAIATEPAHMTGDFATIMKWADKIRAGKMMVEANADTPAEAINAVNFGADGIGLCRTEHMFRNGERLDMMQRMILADTTEERIKWLDMLEPYQEEDFYQMYLAIGGINLNVRLLDPPLDEYLPREADKIATLAKETGKTVEDVNKRIAELHMTNPMMGLRGCRLDVVYPEIGRMQTTAVIKAALRAEKTLSEKKGKKVHITASIMVPQVVEARELKFVKDLICETADKIIAASDYDKKLKYKVGTMIETPRAAVTAGEIAKHAAYFSYGTNDLTQFTFGFSRNDYSSYITQYLDNNLIDFDPFKTVDPAGVGRLIELSVREGKATNPELVCGICGETGGDPESIGHFYEYGCDYVSCSPFRVPGARLAAAQAVAKANMAKAASETKAAKKTKKVAKKASKKADKKSK